jgi:hypothetical protein
MQVQARGKSREALDYLETTLALSRQVENDAPIELFDFGSSMQDRALAGLRLWLDRVGPDKQLLREALTLLQRHETARPDPLNSVKAQYVMDREEGPLFLYGNAPGSELLRVAYQVPWEKERQTRIIRAVFLAGYRAIARSSNPCRTRVHHHRFQSGSPIFLRVLPPKRVCRP